MGLEAHTQTSDCYTKRQCAKSLQAGGPPGRKPFLFDDIPAYVLYTPYISNLKGYSLIFVKLVQRLT